MDNDVEFKIGDLVFERYYLKDFCIPLPVFIVGIEEQKYCFYYLGAPEKVYKKIKTEAYIQWCSEEFNWYGKSGDL